MLYRVGISCCILHSIVSYFLYAVVDKLPRLGKRELVFLLLLTCYFVVSVRRRFHLVLGLDALFYCGTPWTFHSLFCSTATSILSSKRI